MDKLEKFITKHRERFDNREPDNMIWKKIEGNLDKHNKHKWLTGGILWKAASVVLLITVIWLLADRNGKMSVIDQVTLQESADFDLSEVEKYYTSIIQARQEQIRDYINEYPELDQRFLNDLNRLDENYEKLKMDLEIGYNEKILNAMIVNLQMQIEVLNQQLEIIENFKNMREDETVNI
ncbi:hypothetical protein ACFLU5_17315 [Bacteroidota bacterium]